MIKHEVSIKTIIKPDAPTKFRREVGSLLNTLMKENDIKGRDADCNKAFKDTFKSNLYYLIDNYFKVKSQTKDRGN